MKLRNLLILTILLPAACLFGQDASTVASNTAPAPAGDIATAPKPKPSKAEILEELRQMQARIQQLEAALRAEDESASSKPADTVATPVAAQALLAATAPPKKEEKATPFAFADWSWLNGN